MSKKTYWAVEIEDHHPVMGGKVTKSPFAFKAHAEVWAKSEVSAARELGLECTYRVLRCEV